MRNKASQLPRIFVGPVEIAGYYRNLSIGFKLLGISHDYITFKNHPFAYGGESQSPILLRLAKWFDRSHGKFGRHTMLRVLTAFPGTVLRSLFLLEAIFRYDIFIFAFGQSLLRYNWDLPVLRFLGKRIIMNMFHGSELRPPYINGALQSKDGSKQLEVHQLRRYTLEIKKRIRIIERYTDLVIGAPFSSTQFASKPMINYFVIGFPCQLSESPPISNQQIEIDRYQGSNPEIPKQSVRILHSPSHPAAKGSSLIQEAIQNLKNKGYAIEFIQLTGRPHQEVLSEIQQCDFVVDQIYSDIPMGGFATEAAWFGKPAVVGGYRIDHLQQFVPERMWPPSKICHPTQIERAIEDLIVNPQERLMLGKQAQDFVRRRWSATEVAQRYLRLIEGDIPDEWWLDPHDVEYLYGVGQSVEVTKKNIRTLIEHYGIEVLQLSHRPSLERAFLEFAGIKEN